MYNALMDLPRILPVWQPVGHSTHIIAAKVAEKYHVLTSHTGTLDPMAEGVIIVLLDEERYKKYEYAEWEKEYEFDIAFGITTDTYDGMGLVTSFYDVDVNEECIAEVMKEFVGEYVQDVPPYSSIKIDGKPLHWFARNKLLSGIDIPKRMGKVFDINLLKFYKIDFKDLVSDIEDRMNKVTGNFRQEKIKTRWHQLSETVDPKFQICVARVRVVLSKGLYVRSLSQDIAVKLNSSGFVFKLKRVRNGMYTRELCKSLPDLFGVNYHQHYDFVSRGDSES